MGELEMFVRQPIGEQKHPPRLVCRVRADNATGFFKANFKLKIVNLQYKLHYCNWQICRPGGTWIFNNVIISKLAVPFQN
jgi:hypothetical protein